MKGETGLDKGLSFLLELSLPMRHIVIAALTVALLLTGCSAVLAQESTSTSTGSTRQTPFSTGTSLRETPRKQIIERKEERIATREAKRQERRETIASKAAERKESMDKRLQEHKELMASKAVELKAKLAEFKDKKRAAIVEKVNTVLNIINTKRTDEMKKHLAKMSELLAKLEDRVDAKDAQGKDTTAANAAIASASAAIASASSAVDAQALKDYTVTISSESAARADTKATRNRLHQDLQAVRKLVIDAKQALSNAIRIAATTLGGIGDGK